jgi:hypothetical protein
MGCNRVAKKKSTKMRERVEKLTREVRRHLKKKLILITY